MDEKDKKQQYIAQREEFKGKKAEWLEQISQHQSAIARFEKLIEDARPRTKNGRRTCERCDCVSMRYMGRTLQGGLTGGDDVYECEICGTENIDPSYL